jgi:hypothetical protein
MGAAATQLPIDASLSDFAEAWILLDGKPFRLDDWPMHRAFYDGRFRRTLFKTSRQVAKSTTLANFSILECALVPHFSTMFVSPSKEQTTRFSTTRVGKVMRYSPIINKRFLHPDLSDRVFHKQFTNGSEMLFTYGCDAIDGADRLRGPSTDRNCYDKEAYALTRLGWKKVSEVTQDDLIADVNDLGIVEWNAPTQLIKKKYTGKMVTFSHRGFHLRVTGDHKIWLNYSVKHSPAYHQEDKYEFVPALEAAQTSRMGFKLTSKVAWHATKQSTRTFLGTFTPEVGEQEALVLPLPSFARLTGWYLAEGYTRMTSRRGKVPTSPRIVITQTAGRGLKDILDTLEQCNLPYRIEHAKSRTTYNIVVKSETLGRYFLPLGKSREKSIPREFFNYPECLKQLLQSLYAGDASYHKGELWENGTLRTRSRQLAEDVQEAWLRLGRPAVIHTRMMAPNPESEKEPLYEVCSYDRDYIIFWRADFEKKKRVSIEATKNEEVYCFTVKNHRPIVKGNFKSIPCVGSQCFDEVQDMLYDPVIIVGNETLSESDYAYETYAGTPKSMENTIQFLWELSTQTEWVMKCDACNTYQYIDSEKSLGKHGPICVKCGKYIDPFLGQWIDMSPLDQIKGETVDQKLKGFHVSQLMMPRNSPLSMRNHRNTELEAKAQSRWDRILVKHRESPTSLFKNEVLGVSDTIGTRMISLDELRGLCTGPALTEVPTQATFRGTAQVIAGVDWSGGGTSGLSRTVLWIWGYRPSDQKLVCLFYKVYPGTNPVHVVEEIGRICKNYRVSMTVGDAGEGALANDLLRKFLGGVNVSQVQYGSQSKALTFNGVDRYLADRTTLIDNYFMLLKEKKIEFGPVEQMEVAIDDILNEYEEVTQSGKKVWRHSPQKPDDCLHAGLFGWIAWKIIQNDFRFYQQ